MTMRVNGQVYYSTGEACQMAGISKSTLLRWIREGKVPEVTYVDRNGYRLFTQGNIRQIKRKKVG